MKALFACLGLAVAAPAWAATQTVKLMVPDMTCAACPITVRKALTKIEGVRKIDFDVPKREVLVTFDDTKTNVHQLTHATKGAGYPATVMPSSTK